MSNRATVSLETLYREAVDLADRARAWFDGPGVAWRAALPVDAQARAATESLAITARLMAVMSWLLDPAQSADTPLRTFAVRAEPVQPLASPLAGTPGEALAEGSRRLVEKVAALAADGAAASVGQG